MTILNTGWTKTFGRGWDAIFGGRKSSAAKATAKAAPATSAAKKKSAKKKAAKKASKGKRRA